MLLTYVSAHMPPTMKGFHQNSCICFLSVSPAVTMWHTCQVAGSLCLHVPTIYRLFLSSHITWSHLSPSVLQRKCMVEYTLTTCIWSMHLIVCSCMCVCECFCNIRFIITTVDCISRIYLRGTKWKGSGALYATDQWLRSVVLEIAVAEPAKRLWLVVWW